MAANLAIGAIAAVLALFGGLSVARAIDDAVPEDRWIPGIELPSVTTPEGTVPGVTTPERPAGPARPSAPRALHAPLYRPATFAEVLRRLRAVGGPAARLSVLRVAENDVVAQVQGRGKRVVFIVRSGGYQQTVTTPASAGPATFPLARVRAAVPATLERRVARMAGVAPGRIDYLAAVRSPVEATPYWVIFVRGGGLYRAQIDGRGLRRAG
jgi:hypothetical protein